MSGHNPELLADLNRCAVQSAMMAKFGIARGTKTEREIAEIMQRIPNDAILAEIRSLQRQVDWLRDWLDPK